MIWWHAASWGLFGGFCVEGLALYSDLRKRGWNWPTLWTLGPFIVGEAIRLGVGAGLAVAMVRAGQVSGEFGAMAVGAAAPLVVEKIAGSFPGGN